MPGIGPDTPGIGDELTIDGASFRHPKEWQITPPIRQAVFEAMNQTQTITSAYDGDGLPIVLDSFSFGFPWDLDAQFADLAFAIRRLRVAGGVHTLAYWKKEPYAYALRAGQATFWLPRGDAAAQGYVGFDGPTLAAVVSIPLSSEPTPTTVYQTSVSAGDSVPADEVWISQEMTRHPTSGKYLAFCKLGTAPSVRATMEALFYPLFRIVVTALAVQYPMTSKETLTLMCAETN